MSWWEKRTKMIGPEYGPGETSSPKCASCARLRAEVERLIQEWGDLVLAHDLRVEQFNAVVRAAEGYVERPVYNSHDRLVEALAAFRGRA